MTDRTIRSAAELDTLRFPEGGLLPVVVQDEETGEVLMVAFADREAVERTLETGEMHYRSRSRGELWRKGATSGNTQALVSLHADCDGDTLLARVRPAGPACHTGERSCFGRLPAREADDDAKVPRPRGRGGTADARPPGDGTELPRPRGEGASPDAPGPGEGAARGADVLASLWRTLEARASGRPEGSYTVRLLRDPNLRAKKLGEETAELVLALGGESRERAVEEAADLLYHLLVALLGTGATLDDLLAELGRRHRP